MELHQLRYFLAAAQTSSFSKGARQSFVSQPSLSQQIAKLESELNQPLFRRLGRRVALTPAGEQFVELAQRVLGSVEAAERAMHELKQGGGRLSIGAIPTIAPYLLPKVVASFAARHPSAQLEIHELLTRHLLDAVLAGTVDIAILAAPVADQRFAVRSIFSEPLLVCLPAMHRLAKHSTLSIKQIRDERFILLSEMHCLGKQMTEFCTRNACFRIGCHTAQLATVQALIGLKQGISLIPAMARATLAAKGIVFRRLEDAAPTREVILVWRKNLKFTQLEESFLAQLKPTQPGSGRRRQSAQHHAPADPPITPVGPGQSAAPPTEVRKARSN